MFALSSLAKTILLNHISRFHSSSLLSNNLKIGRSRKHYFSLWSKSNLFQHAYDDLLRVYLKDLSNP